MNLVRFGVWTVLFLWAAALPFVPCGLMAGETGPALPSEENLHPAPVGEQPHVRYWLRDPASPEETPPQVVTAVAPALSVAPMPVVTETGGTTRTIEDRRASMQDLFGQMLKKAKDAYNQKDYGRCISICRNVLTADPRHKGAAELMSKARLAEVAADKKVTDLAGARKDEEMFLESDQRAIRPPVRIPEERPYWPRRSDEPVSQRRIDMKKVLDEPVTVDFVQADLEWVLNTLFIITGVNIIADPAALEGKALTLHVEKVPLKEVLEFIVRNNDGIQYSVTDHALWITATSAEDLKKIMYPKVYPIHHGLVSSVAASGMSAGGGGAGGSGRSNQTGRAGSNTGRAGGGQQGQGQQGEAGSYLEMVLDWIATQADTQMFPDGSQYFVDKPSNNLVVYTTPAGHEKIKEFLDVFDQPPIQVLIKTRFLRVKDVNDKGVGVSLDSLYGKLKLDSPNNAVPWNFVNNATMSDPIGTLGASTIMTISGSRLDPKFEFTVKALLADKRTKVLSEPQILAMNNKEAYIDITTNFSYITDLREVNGTTFGGDGTAASDVVAYVPEFDTENIGFTLFVTPSVGRDLKTINLHLRPVVDDLAEGQTIQNFQSFDVINVNNQQQTPPVIQRPTIDQTSLETDVVLEDNGFVIIGGLVRNARTVVEKKIPGLNRIPGVGHLFKSKSETVDRTNLVIIVEAQIITPRGRTYRTDANPDDGDVREGGANRAPGQVSEMVPPVLPPVAREQAPGNKPRSIGVWKVNEDQREPK